MMGETVLKEENMALCIYGRIERKSLNEKTIESYINHYFNNGDRIIKQNTDLTTYEIKNDHNKTIVSFINEKKISIQYI